MADPGLRSYLYTEAERSMQELVNKGAISPGNTCQPFLSPLETNNASAHKGMLLLGKMRLSNSHGVQSNSEANFAQKRLDEG